MLAGKKQNKNRERRNSRICIYSINAPHQNYDLYVVFYVIFFHVVFKVCIYADPCTVEEQKQR